MLPWVEDYIRLCIRLDAALAQQGHGPFLDCYYGPPALQQQALAEPLAPLQQLIAEARDLLARLPSQNFEHQRAAYLEKQVIALETFGRIFSGESLSLQERIRGCLNVDPLPKSEEDLTQAIQLLDRALPGPGDLRQRFQAWNERNILPPEKVPLTLSLMETILAEARRRTAELVDLPSGEGLDIHTVQDKPYGAANWYLGGCRSRLELNITRPIDLSAVIFQMCHEGYPGHHTEYAVKESRLYHGLERDEMCIYILSPQLVISEGIATLAFEMAFKPEEAAEWMTEHLYTPLGVPVNDVDLATLFQALALLRTDELASNFTLMMEAGSTDEQMVEFAMTFLPYPEHQVRGWLQAMKLPLSQIYNFSYHQGVRLMQPLLQGDDRKTVFRRLLTEQVYPSLLKNFPPDSGKILTNET